MKKFFQKYNIWYDGLSSGRKFRNTFFLFLPWLVLLIVMDIEARFCQIGPCCGFVVLILCLGSIVFSISRVNHWSKKR